jgi:K+-sensing histidine kinase KdpD
LRPFGGWPSSSAGTSSRRTRTIFVATVRAVAADRGTTYVFIGTPDSRRSEEVLKGSLVMRLVRALPGIDLRIVADPELRGELEAGGDDRSEF